MNLHKNSRLSVQRAGKIDVCAKKFIDKINVQKGKGKKLKNQLKHTECYQFLTNSRTNVFFQKMKWSNGIRIVLKENAKLLRKNERKGNNVSWREHRLQRHDINFYLEGWMWNFISGMIVGRKFYSIGLKIIVWVWLTIFLFTIIYCNRHEWSVVK